MTCTQCGALIKRISLEDKFAYCDYCGAKILLEENKEKIVEIPGKEELTPYQKYLKKRNENSLKYAAMNPPSYSSDESDPAVWKPLLAVFLVMGVIIFFAASGRSCLDRPLDSTEKTPATKSTPYFFASPFPTVEPTVYPQINYQVSVTWDGSNDMEHFENPTIDGAKLTTSDEKELKRTVFKNRSVRVKVTIDENGEVTEATAISGHPILKEAAENAARKTLFTNRRKPTDRLLTYVFRLVTE